MPYGIASLAVVANLLFVPVTASASAFDIFNNACQSPDASPSAVCQDKGKGGTNPLTGPNGVIRKVAVITAAIAGIAGVVMLILASLTYIMANGEAGKIKQAQDMIKYTIAGLVVVALADSIISFVLNKLL